MVSYAVAALCVTSLTTLHFNQPLNPPVVRRLMRELMQLKNEPLEGIRVIAPEENMLDVTGIIEGPGKSSFETNALAFRMCFPVGLTIPDDSGHTLRRRLLQSQVQLY